MKKNKNSPLLKFFLRFGGAIFFLFTLLFLYYLYYLNLSERLTYKITSDVIVINDILTSMYLVECDSGYIAVDTGMDERIIKRGLQYHGIEPEDIKTILLTHSDYDHVNLLDYFPDADVYISRIEYNMVKESKGRFFWLPFYANSLDDRSYNLLDDDETKTVGSRNVKGILLPGHTTGSMAYLVDDKYFFTGDAFRLKNGKIAIPWKKHIAMDTGTMQKSIYKLKMMENVEYIFTANSGFTADFNYARSTENK